MTEQPSRDRRPLAEELPDEQIIVEPEPGQPSQASGPRADDPAAALRIEAGLRQANLLRIREDLPGAIRHLRQVLETDSQSGAAHEMLGDLLFQAGRLDKALESFRQAQSCGASPAVEAKIARTLVKSHSAKTGIADDTLVRGRGGIAITASVLIPGLGLALAGQMRAAAISFLGWLITLCLLLAIPSTRGMIESPAALTRMSPGGLFLGLTLGIANMGFYVYSLIETARVSKPAGKDGQDD
jgi:tetratricopeptide (TPR) repeat protein